MAAGATHGGKGSAPRPTDKVKFESNWDAIFNKKDKEAPKAKELPKARSIIHKQSAVNLGSDGLALVPSESQMKGSTKGTHRRQSEDTEKFNSNFDAIFRKGV